MASGLLPAYLALGQDQLKRETSVKRLKKRLQEGLEAFNLDERQTAADIEPTDIAISLNTLPTRRGGRRCTSNTYTLLFLPSKDEGAPLQPVQGGTARDAGPRYDREITMDVPKGHSPSVEATDPDPDPDQGETSLKTILFRLQLDLFEDRPFAKAVRHALRRMYHSDSIRVKGERIPRETVREALSLLTIDHIDFVERQLREATSQVVCGEAYLMSCLYNAPLDCLAKSRCG